ncbi:J domain-containing protein [Prochlorococcus sp. MIT 1300]|uniref:J domain-containing protein n=1 Tax=Prochlorococcus sp. MIT 1300 TaxID=3096218 RepID=UPI002A760634|nr:DnaJ domain-containing protein [Prochlorococcus sp. MIT 1300]
MILDPYKVLKVSSDATTAEIKAAYRSLVKRHHPDAGGEETEMLKINAAWAILSNQTKKYEYDQTKQQEDAFSRETQKRSIRNSQATAAAHATKGQITAAHLELMNWINHVYLPIDKLLGQVINPFNAELKALSADPYDDILMNNFSRYLSTSQNRLQKVDNLYRSTSTPVLAQGFSLSLYHCLSQVQDAIVELERYTMGYVDSYLHDGQEMLREAKRMRLRLKSERHNLKAS